MLFESDYSYWQRIYGHRLYHTEQIHVEEILLDLHERWYPGLTKEVEVTDVATPLSYERYTGNWLGSTCGWLLTKQTMLRNVRGVPNILPGLGNFYMAGQWVESGESVSLAAVSARNAVQQICHAAGRSFTTATP